MPPFVVLEESVPELDHTGCVVIRMVFESIWQCFYVFTYIDYLVEYVRNGGGGEIWSGYLLGPPPLQARGGGDWE